MHVFQSPGLADPAVNDAALTAWNAQIDGLVGGHRVSPFLVHDPLDIDNGQIANSVKWPGNPREPLDCLGEELTTKLSDWGWPGRAELHNEYLEYSLVIRPDANGKALPWVFFGSGTRIGELLNVRLAQIKDKGSHFLVWIGFQKTYKCNLAIFEGAGCLRQWINGRPANEEPDAQLFPPLANPLQPAQCILKAFRRCGNLDGLVF